jgi:multicomponent K+:H+ antiporter subunit E
VLGWGLPRLLGGFLGPAAHPRSFARALRLGFTVLWDIIVSNITVARLVLSPRSVPHPAWVKVPLTLTQPTAQALLASIITMTPRYRVGHRGRRGGLHLGARPRLR